MTATFVASRVPMRSCPETTKLQSSLKIEAPQPVGPWRNFYLQQRSVLMAFLRSGHKPCALIKFRRQKCRTDSDRGPAATFNTIIEYFMMSLHLRNHFGKVCALAATILILPVLAHAQNRGGNGSTKTPARAFRFDLLAPASTSQTAKHSPFYEPPRSPGYNTLTGS